MTRGGAFNVPEQQLDSTDFVGSLRTADPSGHQYSAQLFGPFQISRGGIRLDEASGLSRKSVRTLLKWFLLNPEVRVESATLKELLWPESQPCSNTNRLHVTLHYLRHLLEPRLNCGVGISRLTPISELIDDLALHRLEAAETSDFYELIVERHRTASTIITSNREPPRS